MNTESNKNGRILVVAPAGYDMTVMIEDLDTKEFSVSHKHFFQGGGHGGNLCWYLDRQGVKCSLYTHWGTDFIADMARETFAATGVDISQCRQILGTTSQNNIVINSRGAKKVILNFGNALAEDQAWEKGPEIPEILYTTLLPKKPAMEMLRKAKAQGATVILGLQVPTRTTAALGLNHEDLLWGLKNCDYCMGSYSVFKEEMASIFTPLELGQWLVNRYKNLKGCLMTNGSAGSIGFFAGQVYQQTGFQVAAADDTGAGEQYTAAFIKEFFFDNKQVQTAMAKAAAYSAAACTKEGARVRVEPWEAEAMLDER